MESIEHGTCLYDGDFNDDGKPHGKGTALYPKKKIKTGEKDADKDIDTFDIVCEVYIGEWKNGERDGEGVYKFINKDTYTGNWKNGKFHGHGELIQKNGNIVNGIWKEGELHGKVVVRYDCGCEHDQVWENGKHVSSILMNYDDDCVKNCKAKNNLKEWKDIIVSGKYYKLFKELSENKK